MKQFVQHHVKQHPQPNLETKCSHTTFFVAGFLSLSLPPTYYVHLASGDNFIILFNFYLMALSHFNTNGHDHAPIMFYERSRKPEQHNRSLNVRTNALCRPACLPEALPNTLQRSLWWRCDAYFRGCSCCCRRSQLFEPSGICIIITLSLRVSF